MALLPDRKEHASAQWDWAFRNGRGTLRYRCFTVADSAAIRQEARNCRDAPLNPFERVGVPATVPGCSLTAPRAKDVTRRLGVCLVAAIISK
jgi:hypothetical protein